MKTVELTIVSLAVAGVLYALVMGVILRRSGSRRGAVALLFAYVAVSLIWSGGQVAALLGWPPSFPGDFAARSLFYGLLSYRGYFSF